MLCEKTIYTDEYAGTVDLITGIEDFETNIEFDEEWHVYRYNGKLLPSVTQLLDDGEYKNVDKNILEYARKKGTIVHKEIQDYLESHLEGVTSEFYEFLRLYTEEQEKFVKKAIFDFKTYSVATPKNREKCYKQIKMYAEGVKYLTGIEIDNYYMVHLPHNKKGKIYDLRSEFENE